MEKIMSGWSLLVALCLSECFVLIEGPSIACVESLRSKYACGGSTTCERLQCSIKAENGCTRADLTDMGLDPNTNTNMYNKYCNKPRGPASASASASNTYQSRPGQGSYSSSNYKSGSYGGGSSYQPVSASKSSSYSSSRYQPSSSRGSYTSSSSSYRPGSYTGASSYTSSRYKPSSSSSSSSYKSSSRYTPGSSSYSSNKGSSNYKSAYKGY